MEPSCQENTGWLSTRNKKKTGLSLRRKFAVLPFSSKCKLIQNTLPTKQLAQRQISILNFIDKNKNSDHYQDEKNAKKEKEIIFDKQKINSCVKNLPHQFSSNEKTSKNILKSKNLCNSIEEKFLKPVILKEKSEIKNFCKEFDDDDDDDDDDKEEKENQFLKKAKIENLSLISGKCLNKSNSSLSKISHFSKNDYLTNVQSQEIGQTLEIKTESICVRNHKDEEIKNDSLSNLTNFNPDTNLSIGSENLDENPQIKIFNFSETHSNDFHLETQNKEDIENNSIDDLLTKSEEMLLSQWNSKTLSELDSEFSTKFSEYSAIKSEFTLQSLRSINEDSCDDSYEFTLNSNSQFK